MTPTPPSIPATPILFFDGTCGLCTTTVRWFMARDPRGILRFAPLQGSTYAALDVPSKPHDLDTVVLLDQGGLHIRSEATLRALQHLGGFWSALGTLARLCPRPIRDAAYRAVARRRHALAGAADSCPLPTPQQLARLLP